jgi:hypothetical protein
MSSIESKDISTQQDQIVYASQSTLLTQDAKSSNCTQECVGSAQAGEELLHRILRLNAEREANIPDTVNVDWKKWIEKRVHQYMKNGDIRKAAKSITAKERRMDHSHVSKLQEKFPSMKSPVSSFDFAPSAVRITPYQARKAIKRLNRRGARCIDGWVPALLIPLLNYSEDSIGKIAALLTLIARQGFDTTTMDMLTASRVVGIPKGDADWRPLTLTNLFVKLLSICCLDIEIEKKILSLRQFGIRRPFGLAAALKIVRDAVNAKRFCFKLDARNAFNELSRSYIYEVLAATSDVTTKAFYNLLYARTSYAFLYLDKGAVPIHIQEGVKQGCPMSAYIFALALDVLQQKILDEVKSLIPESRCELVCYLDDITIIADSREEAMAVYNVLKKQYSGVGLTFNDDNPEKHYIFNHRTHTGVRFLGADIVGDQSEYILRKKNELTDLYKALLELNLHPHIVLVLCRFVLSAKLIFMAQHWSDIDEVKQMVIFHHSNIVKILNSTFYLNEDAASYAAMLGVNDLAANLESVREQFSQLSNWRAQPWQLKKNDAEKDAQKQMENTQHTFSSPLCLSFLGCQASAFLYYDARNVLTPSQFITAMHLRFRSSSLFPSRFLCVCGFELCGGTKETVEKKILHVLACSQTTHGATLRHNAVLYSLASVFEKHGLTCTVEPRFYTYIDQSKKRPDITVHTVPRLVCDMTFVNPSGHNHSQAEVAAQNKIEKHNDAVQNLGQVFLSGAAENGGHLHQEFVSFVNRVCDEVAPWRKRECHLNAFHTISTTHQRELVTSVQNFEKRRNERLHLDLY